MLFVDDARLVGTGLPFERFDVLLVAGAVQELEANAGEASESRMAQLLGALLPACNGATAAHPDLLTNLDLALEKLNGGLRADGVERENMVTWLVEMMLRANARHRGA